MKFLLAFLLLTLPLSAAPQDEMLVIEELISATKRNLASQEELMRKLVAFKGAREAYLANPDSGKYATSLVKQAMQLHQHLEKERVSHLFSNDFLTELSFYNKIGKQT